MPRKDQGAMDKSAWWLAVAGVIGAIIGALITGAFSYLSHQGDLDARMIELSVGVLRAKPTPETIPLRAWAIDVIQKRGGFIFNEEQRAALLKRELPLIPFTFSATAVSQGLPIPASTPVPPSPGPTPGAAAGPTPGPTAGPTPMPTQPLAK